MCMTRILTTLLLTVLFSSFDTVDAKLKDGYYISSHGHVTLLYGINGDKIEWQLDNAIKSWGEGKYEILQADSVMRISLKRFMASQKGEFGNEEFDYPIEITWDRKERLFRLKDYRYTENFDMINDVKRRVKSSCKIRVERPSR